VYRFEWELSGERHRARKITARSRDVDFRPRENKQKSGDLS
jgi:hypothetical protein